MSWLTPLGFLGLIGLLILILIYIIKPNFQNKIVSSTFVWKLSLKYKKNKIPLSKLRNILLLLCQILIITLTSVMLAQPYFKEEDDKIIPKKVFILDASASMMASVGNGDSIETRFSLALSEMEAEIEETLKLEESEVSIILAHDTASFLVEKATAFTKGEVTSALDELKIKLQNDEHPCTYGTPDIEGAIRLSEKITAFTPDVEVLLYTDTNYIDAGQITVKNMSAETDYNVAVLDVRMVSFDNRYYIEVDVVCHGTNKAVTVNCEVTGTYSVFDDKNKELSIVDDQFTVSATANLRDGEITTIYIPEYTKSDFDGDETEFGENFKEDYPELYRLESFTTVSASVDENDSLAIDNAFNLYGGKKPVLKIQYCSYNPNRYFSTIIGGLREDLGYRWDIDYDEIVINKEDPKNDPNLDKVGMAGYDFYIFETVMPAELPENGVSIILDPAPYSDAPVGADFKVLGSYVYPSSPDNILSEGNEHPITNKINPEKIEVNRFTRIDNVDASYEPLLYIRDIPMLYARDKDSVEPKVVLMPFSLNFSNLPIIYDFPLMMYNILEYYMPSMIIDYTYDVNENMHLNASGDLIEIVPPANAPAIPPFTAFPSDVTLSVPGPYTVNMSKNGEFKSSETVFVKIPTSESNVVPEVDSLENPFFMVVEEKEEIQNKEIIFYLALALVALLLCEWWLHTREQY